jgi:hypothetical protein
MKIGDWIEPPRFLKVKIEEVLTREESTRQGYTESTHYKKDPDFEIFGKLIGENRMKFAAVKK